MKKEAEHVKFVLENSFHVIRSSEYRKLRKRCVKWNCYVKEYGLTHKKSIKKFTTLVNKIRDLDERYKFSKDDEKYVEYKYHCDTDSSSGNESYFEDNADESTTDEDSLHYGSHEESEQNDPDNGANTDSSNDYDENNAEDDSADNGSEYEDEDNDDESED